jgi:5-methylcytosine-specific restriction endonuclease McrA
VHHKVPLNADNVKDPNIALGWDNLELLCKQCHDDEKQRRAKRWRIEKNGRVII